jgi:hypothetical protein
MVLNKQLNSTMTDISTTADMLTDRKTTSTKASTFTKFFNSSDRQDFNNGASPIVSLLNCSRSPESAELVEESIVTQIYEPLRNESDIIDLEIMNKIETLELDLMFANKSTQSLEDYKRKLDYCVEFNANIQHFMKRSNSKVSQAMRRLVDSLIGLAQRISSAYEEQIKSEHFEKERMEVKIKQLEETLMKERKEVEDRERLREEESKKIKQEIDELFTVDKEYDYIKDRNLKLMDYENNTQIVERLKDIYVGLQKEIQIPSRDYEDPKDFDELELELRDKLLFLQKHTAYKMAYSIKRKDRFVEVGVQSDNPFVENGVSIRDLYDNLKVSYTTVVVNNKKLQEETTALKEKATFYEGQIVKSRIEADQASATAKSFKDKVNKMMFKKASLQKEMKTISEKADRAKIQIQNLVKIAVDYGVSKEALASVGSQASLLLSNSKASLTQLKAEGQAAAEDSQPKLISEQRTRRSDDVTSSVGKSNISFSRYGSSASEYEQPSDRDPAKAIERQRQREKRKKELLDELKSKSIDEGDQNNEAHSPRAQDRERSPRRNTFIPDKQDTYDSQTQASHGPSPSPSQKRKVEPGSTSKVYPGGYPGPSNSHQSPRNRSPRRHETGKAGPGPLNGYPSFESSNSEEFHRDPRAEYLPGSPRVSVRTRGSNQASIIPKVASASHPNRERRSIIGQTENSYEFNSEGEPIVKYQNNLEGYFPSFATREIVGPTGEIITLADRGIDAGFDFSWSNVKKNTKGIQYNWEIQEEDFDEVRHTYEFSFNPNQVFGLQGDAYYKTRNMIFNPSPKVPLSYKNTYRTTKKPKTRTKSISPSKTPTSIKEEDRTNLVKTVIPGVREGVNN